MNSHRVAAAGVCGVLFLLLLLTPVHGQVPQLINYQGRVVVGATNFNGTGQLKFAFVDGAGNTLWRNHGVGAGEPANAVAVVVTNGLYSVLLGDTSLPNMNAIPTGVFSGPDVRLRVWFSDGTLGSQQLTPDQRFAAVGYAIMSAGVPDGAITAAKIASGAVGATQIAAGTVSGDLWRATPLTGLSGRFGHTAVWTGTEMIVWGGAYGGASYNDGARYNPALNVWTPVSTVGAPAGRSLHTAVWTGSEMIVWGGLGSSGHLNDGGRYNPTTNTWTPLSTSGAPAARRYHTAVWTGSEMMVWGGGIGGGIQGVTKFNDGGRYNPASNSWTPTNPSGTPAARYLHTAVWSGSEMIVWGGLGTTLLNDGARYNPGSNAWTPVNVAGAPAVRSNHTAVWTGIRMIIFGGSGADVYKDGASYDPIANSWVPIANAAGPRGSHTALWTGGEMLVWGGIGTASLNTGERYSPATDSWAPTTLAGAPPARSAHVAVWTGSEMVVWGGVDGNTGFSDGARLRLSNILNGSISGAQLGAPLQLSGTSTTASTFSGSNSATGGIGLAGASSGGNSGIGVSGDGGTGTGVKGVATGFSGTGVLGFSVDGTGILGESTNATGVYGNTTTGIAIYGVSSGSGLAGSFIGDVHVLGSAQGSRGGATGTIGASSAGVEGLGAGGGTGVLGKGGSPNGIGVSGIGGINGYGIYGSSNQYAGWFNGAVNITGSLFKGGGAFRIDHPLDPANKYLAHSFVESPDMMNIYNGNVTLDRKGESVVLLPEWFGALNKEFRYQLTCIGGFAPVYIAEEMADNRFKIAGGKPGLRVSWQVTGIRQDAWANAHRIQVEEAKPEEEQGTYLHPELRGQPLEKSVEAVHHPELPRQRRAQMERESATTEGKK